MNALFTFNAQQLSQQLRPQTNILQRPAPKSTRLPDPRSSRKNRRYDQLALIFAQSKQKNIQIIVNGPQQGAYLQEEKLKRFLSSNLEMNNATVNPFLNKVEIFSQGGLTKQVRKQGNNTNNQEDFTFYPRNIKEQLVKQDESMEFASKSKSNRSKSLRLTPKVVFPTSDRKLPNAFKINSTQNKIREAIRARIPSSQFLPICNQFGHKTQQKPQMNKLKRILLVSEMPFNGKINVENEELNLTPEKQGKQTIETTISQTISMRKKRVKMVKRPETVNIWGKEKSNLPTLEDSPPAQMLN